MARAAKARAAAGRTAGWKWWHGMAAGILLMMSPGSALMVTALFAPALFAAVADTTPGRPLARTVGLFSMAATFEPIRAFIAAGYDLPAAFGVLRGVGTIPLVWCYGGCGWLLNEFSCMAAVLATNLRLAARRKALEALLEETRKEWAITD